MKTQKILFCHVHLEHLECSLQPSPPGCFTKKLSEARGNVPDPSPNHRDMSDSNVERKAYMHKT